MGIMAIPIPIQVVSHSFTFPFPILSLIPITMGIPWDSHSHWESHSHGHLYSPPLPYAVVWQVTTDRTGGVCRCLVVVIACVQVCVGHVACSALPARRTHRPLGPQTSQCHRDPGRRLQARRLRLLSG